MGLGLASGLGLVLGVRVGVRLGLVLVLGFRVGVSISDRGWG